MPYAHLLWTPLAHTDLLEIKLQPASQPTKLAPLAPCAQGATSKATLDRARGIYGSRVVRLASADAATILEEKNAFTLFVSGAYRSAADKDTKAVRKCVMRHTPRAPAASYA